MTIESAAMAFGMRFALVTMNKKITPHIEMLDKLCQVFEVAE
jgi:hypothetical protein